MSTKICGTCAYYRDTALHGIICGKTKKPCGYLHEKDCWTALEEKPTTTPAPTPTSEPKRRRGGRVSRHPNYVDRETGHTMKWCTKCNQYKPIDDFPNNKSRRDGKAGECKTCHNAWTLEYQRKRAAARKQDKVPKVEIHKEAKVSKSVTINARLVSMGLDSSGIGFFEFVTSKPELRKLAPLWGNEELTVTVTSVEIVKD